MSIVAATRRASCRSSIEQQLPNDRSPSAVSDASYSCIDRPMTSWPCSASSAAATDESTPPDIATTIRTFLPAPSPVYHEDTKKHEGHEPFCGVRISSLPREPE